MAVAAATATATAARVGPGRAVVGAMLLAAALSAPVIADTDAATDAGPGAARPASSVAGTCRALDLPVQTLADAPTAYTEFCRRHPPDCRLDGPALLTADDATWARLGEINRAVNAEVTLMPDWERVGEEEHWDYPARGRGDCEDIALEKRRRLVAAGLPRAAFTMAIVHARSRPTSHAVLLVETRAGTYVLDNVGDALVCWAASAYNFEARERVDGRWSRYDQRTWTYPPRAGC